MKPQQIILIGSQGWFDLVDGQCVERKPWADVNGPALVVVDFPDSQTGVQASPGKPEYAAAQIEKSVRAEGSIEGPLHVIVHRQVTHEKSCLTLYTAISLEQWQEYQSWAKRQSDHCLLVPVAGLLGAQPADEHVHVLRMGSQLHALYAHGNRLHYASAATLGRDAGSRQAQMRTMLSLLRANGWDGVAKGFRWGCALTDDLDAERQLLGLGDQTQGGTMNARLLPHESFKQAGQALMSALPDMLTGLPSKAMAAPLPARLAWLSEKYVLPLAAMLAVIAIGLGGFALLAERMIRDEQQVLAGMQGESTALRDRVTQANRLQASGMNDETVNFARQLGYAAMFDPVRMLGNVRRAAGPAIRIQRLQLTRTTQRSEPQFRIDGVVSNGSNEELSRFLGELRGQGWKAESATPSDSSIGAFAYILQPIAQRQDS